MRHLLLSLLLAVQLHAQHSFLLKGRITNLFTHEALVHCMVKDSASGQIMYSDKNGNYELRLTTYNPVIYFTLLGYAQQHRRIIFKNRDTLFLNIQLEPENFQLAEALIVAEKKPVPVVNRETYFPYDFNFNPNQELVVLCGIQGKIQSFLMLFDSSGTEKKRIKLKQNIQELFRDCLGNLHLVSSDSAQQFYFNAGLELVTFPALSRKEFDHLVKPCVAHHPHFGYYLREWNAAKQEFAFYRIDTTGRKHILTFVESPQARRYRDEHQFLARVFGTGIGQLASGSTSGENSIRSEAGESQGGTKGVAESIALQRASNAVADQMILAEKVIYIPPSCPLFVQHDSLLLFNHCIDSLLFFTTEGKLNGSVEVAYHHNRSWKQEVYFDKVSGHYYTGIVKEGLHHIFSIDLKTGGLGNLTIIPHPSPNKIAIQNGELFYIAIKDRESRQKIIYRMSLNN